MRDIEFVAAFDIDKNKVGKDLAEGHLCPAEQYVQIRRRGHDRHHRPPRDDPRRARQVPVPDHRKSPRSYGRCRRDSQSVQGRRRRFLFAGRVRRGDQVVCGAGCSKPDAPGQLHPGIHRAGKVLAAAFRRTWSADHRRRHQIPGGSDDHPSRSNPTVCRPRRARRPHLSTEFWRQHGLSQHARAGTPRVEKDLENQRRHLDAGTMRSRRSPCMWGQATMSRG